MCRRLLPPTVHDPDRRACPCPSLPALRLRETLCPAAMTDAGPWYPIRRPCRARGLGLRGTGRVGIAAPRPRGPARSCRLASRRSGARPRAVWRNCGRRTTRGDSPLVASSRRRTVRPAGSASVWGWIEWNHVRRFRETGTYFPKTLALLVVDVHEQRSHVTKSAHSPCTGAVRAIWPSSASSSCFTLLRCFCRLVRVSQGVCVRSEGDGAEPYRRRCGGSTGQPGPFGTPGAIDADSRPAAGRRRRRGTRKPPDGPVAWPPRRGASPGCEARCRPQAIRGRDRFGNDCHGELTRNGAPGRTRTPNLLIRSQALYPIELRAPANRVREPTHFVRDLQPADRRGFRGERQGRAAGRAPQPRLRPPEGLMTFSRLRGSLPRR